MFFKVLTLLLKAQALYGLIGAACIPTSTPDYQHWLCGMVWVHLSYKPELLNANCLRELILACANPDVFPGSAWGEASGPDQMGIEVTPTMWWC